MMASLSNACPACRGSGRLRDINLLTTESRVRTCNVCRGSGKVQGLVSCPQVNISGTVRVINPGDPGFAEAKRRLEERKR